MDDAENSVKYQSTPLLLFFPVLDELGTGWTTRRVVANANNSTVIDHFTDVTWMAGELMSRSFDDPVTYQPFRTAAYLIHELLALQVLPRIWDLVSQAPSHEKTVSVLKSLIWLLCREELLFRSRLARPRLHLALRVQLKPILTLLNSQVEFTEVSYFRHWASLFLTLRPILIAPQYTQTSLTGSLHHSGVNFNEFSRSVCHFRPLNVRQIFIDFSNAVTVIPSVSL